MILKRRYKNHRRRRALISQYIVVNNGSLTRRAYFVLVNGDTAYCCVYSEKLASPRRMIHR